MRVVVALCLSVISFLGFGHSPGPTTERATTPHVTLAFPVHWVPAKHAFVLWYASKDIPSSGHLFLQWQVGSDRVWEGVGELKGISGKGSGPGAPQGQFFYRVTAWVGKNLVAISNTETLDSYANVPLEYLCNNAVNGGGCSPSTFQIGDHVFTAVMGCSGYSSCEGGYPSYATLFEFAPSTCKSISFQFGIDNNSGNSGDVSYLEAVQETVNPVTARTAYTSIGTLNVNLAGGPWYLDAAVSNNYSDNLVVNGAASCYTASGA